MHGFQIWVNLPAKNKMMAPRYQEISAQDSPTIEKNGVWARVIAGECMGVSSSIDTVIPITLILIRMKEGTQLIQQLDSGLNSMIYVFSGNVTIPRETSVRTHPQIFGLGVKQSINDGELGLFSEGEKIVINSNMSSEFLILAGPELNEPIARYGPFVMNSKSEIEQAFYDYNKTEFGGWKWGSPYPIHGIQKEKFAKLINGDVIKPL